MSDSLDADVDTSVGDLRDREESFSGCVGGVGAEVDGQFSFRLDRVDGDDRVVPRHCGGHQGRQPDPSKPENGDRLARARTSGVDHCAKAGEYGAAEECSNRQRDVPGDDNSRSAVDHRVFGEGRDTEVMMKRLSAAVETSFAAEQGAGGVRHRGATAQCGAS